METYRAAIGDCIRATRRGGTVVGMGFAATNEAAVPARFGVLRTLLSVFVGARLLGRRGTFYGITSHRKDPEPFRADLRALFPCSRPATIAPRIAARLPLLAAREASTMLERGGVDGKIVHLASW